MDRQDLTTRFPGLTQVLLWCLAALLCAAPAGPAGARQAEAVLHGHPYLSLEAGAPPPALAPSTVQLIAHQPLRGGHILRMPPAPSGFGANAHGALPSLAPPFAPVLRLLCRPAAPRPAPLLPSARGFIAFSRPPPLFS